MSIKKIDIIESEEGEYYVEYEITHADESKGSADLRIMELDGNHHMRLLLDKGLSSGSKIAETFFYPHCVTSQLRQGIGSQALKAIFDDAQKRGIRAIYCEATKTTGEKFFHKRRFIEVYDRHYYKTIS